MPEQVIIYDNPLAPASGQWYLSDTPTVVTFTTTLSSAPRYANTTASDAKIAALVLIDPSLEGKLRSGNPSSPPPRPF